MSLRLPSSLVGRSRWSVLGFSVLVDGLELAAVLRRARCRRGAELAAVLRRTLAGLDVDGVDVVPTGLSSGAGVSPLLRRELAVVCRTLAGRDGETCSRDLRQSPLGDDVPPAPVAFVATRRPGPGDDVGAMWFFPRKMDELLLGV